MSDGELEIVVRKCGLPESDITRQHLVILAAMREISKCIEPCGDRYRKGIVFARANKSMKIWKLHVYAGTHNLIETTAKKLNITKEAVMRRIAGGCYDLFVLKKRYPAGRRHKPFLVSGYFARLDFWLGKIGYTKSWVHKIAKRDNIDPSAVIQMMLDSRFGTWLPSKDDERHVFITEEDFYDHRGVRRV